jgi:hypothetical protein
MKRKIIFLIISILILGCTPTTTIIPTASLTPSPYPTSTPISYSPEIEVLLNGQCTPPWSEEGSFSKNLDRIASNWYIKNHDCKLPVFSPDRQYLAYATLGQQNKEDKNDLWVDTVKILDLGNKTSRSIHFSHQNDHIANIEWSPTGHLIVSESIWESVLAIFVYDIKTNTLVSNMFLDRGNTLQWNKTKTAFYASSNGGGRGIYSCIQQL